MLHNNNIIKTFARRRGRTFRLQQKHLLSDSLPSYIIKLDQDFSHLKTHFKQINFEIGFGNGSFLFEQAALNPDQLYIGCEPFLNGVTSLLFRLNESNLNNVLIYPDDARLLLRALPKDYLNNIFIICPDPWPKTKHHQRRLINSEFIKFLHSKIKTSGIIKIVTDHADYACWILKHLKKTEIFQSLHDEIIHYEIKNTSDNYFTKFQIKGILKGYKIYVFELNI